MAGQKRVEDARERAYARPSTSLPYQGIKTWMPGTRPGMTSQINAASMSGFLGLLVPTRSSRSEVIANLPWISMAPEALEQQPGKFIPRWSAPGTVRYLITIISTAEYDLFVRVITRGHGDSTHLAAEKELSVSRTVIFSEVQCVS
jgi:hypothetical protein